MNVDDSGKSDSVFAWIWLHGALLTAQDAKRTF